MTTLTETGERILKTDARGRVQTPPERREKLLEEFERSGLSGAKFAELAGIKYQTFAAWATRRRKQRGLVQAPANPHRSVRWLEAVVQESQVPGAGLSGSASLWLHLPGGTRAEIATAQQATLAASLIRALSTP